jgi:ribosomal protein S18 acetylase RimI-like enzyme
MLRIRFRRYEPGDHDAVWSVFAACTRQLGFTLGPWDDDMHNVVAVYNERGGEFIVGEHEGEIVAFAGLRWHSADRAEIRRVGVRPDMQRRGFARTMMQELEDRARGLGFSYLYLDTSISQIAAQKLYQACGYREVGHVDKSGVDCIVYYKQLISTPEMTTRPSGSNRTSNM